MGGSSLSRASVLRMTAGTAVCGPACTVVWEPGLAYWVSLRPPDWTRPMTTGDTKEIVSLCGCGDKGGLEGLRLPSRAR